MCRGVRGHGQRRLLTFLLSTSLFLSLSSSGENRFWQYSGLRYVCNYNREREDYFARSLTASYQLWLQLGKTVRCSQDV